MATLKAQRVSKNGKGGRWVWGGHWSVRDGDTLVATGCQRLWERFDIEIRGRRLRLHNRPHQGCVIVDESTGQPVLELVYTALRYREESAWVTLSSGVRLHWTLRFRDHDRRTGFYDDAGTAIMILGHDLPMDWTKPRSVWGYLWRLWFAAAEASDHILAYIDDAVAARLVRTDELITLVFLMVWLETSKDRRQVNRLAQSGG